MKGKDRWEQIGILIEQALRLPVEKRTDFLKRECDNDNELRREIESLISFDESSEAFLDDIQKNVVSSSMAGLLQELKWHSHGDEPFLTGHNLAHYNIIEKLGSGGMGTVYKASDTKLDRYVALKFLNPRGLHQKDLNEKLLHEAKASASLNHPNIATIYEINEADGQIFIAMEFIDGITLREKMKHATIGLNAAIEYAAGIATALAEAHDLGVIHGDIKPENIMIDSKNRIKVTDFGLAKLHYPANQKAKGAAAGTPEYMPPESIRGEIFDHRSDLWALGIVFYEMLTGRQPFEGDSTVTLLYSILYDKPVGIQDQPSLIPGELVDIIDKLLQKTPAERFTEAENFLEALYRVIPERISPFKITNEEKYPVFKIPKPLTGFIGRKKELTELKELLVCSRLLTLTGVAGSGKTRIAIELAHQSRNILKSGIIFIDLSAIRDSAQVLSYIARTLNLKERSGKAISDQLKAYLQKHGITLVLDNFEQVLDAAPSIADILIHAPQCRMIVTSRQPLHIQGEAIYPVPPLTLPEKTGPFDFEISQYESVTLFIERAKQIRPDFDATSKNLWHIAEICRRLDGLPLAIELAAVRIKLLSPKTLLNRLNDRFNLLTGGTGDLPLRQRSLRTAIEWSYDLLSIDDQTLFRRLAIFAGGFTMNAVRDICRLNPVLSTNIEDGIFSLLDKNLIYITNLSEDSRRFGMLESIREYASEKLSQSGEFVSLRDSHRRYFVQFCKKILPEMTGKGQSHHVEEIDKDYENLIKALEWKSGLETHVENSLILCNVLWRYWLRKCLFSDGRKRMREILKDADLNQDTDLIAEVLLGAGTLAHNNGDYNEALEQITKSLELYRNSENKEGIAKALTNLGWVYWRRGNYRQARALSEEALELQQQLKNQPGVAFALNNLGWIAHHQGEIKKALRYHEKSLDLRRKLGDKRNVAFSLTNSAWANHKLGRYELSENQFNESLELFSELDDRQLLTFSLCLKAELMSDTGRTEEALVVLCKEILPSFREIEDTYGYALSLNCIGIIHFRKKQFTDAKKYLEESKKLRVELGDRWGVGQSLCALARVVLYFGKIDDVYNQFRESYSIRRDLNDKIGLAETLEGLAEYFYLNRSKVSKKHADQLFRIANELRMLTGSPRPYEVDTYICELEKKHGGYTSEKSNLVQSKPESTVQAAMRLLKESDKIIEHKDLNLLG